MSRGWKIAIVASVVLNLFLLGAIAGGLIVGARAFGERGDFRRPGQGQRLSAALQALPPDRRDALRDLMRAQALSAAPDFRAAAEARREAVQLMAQPQYDPRAVADALARARAAEDRARARIDATLASRLGELTQGERATFGRVLLRGPGRGRPPRPQGPPPPGPEAAPPP